MNVTVPAINVAGILADVEDAKGQTETYLFHVEINGQAKEKSVDLTRGKPQAVGRTGANAIVLDDASVSKTHASFVIGADGSLSVADTGSTNGTFINGERIAYGKAVRLAEGDTVRFGSVDVTFEKQPRFEPAQPETDVDAGEAVTIGGFEFRSRPTPEEEQAEASADTPSTPAKSEPIPDETLKMDDDRTLKMPANADEDQPGEKK
jgi:pSer/pThr/pTyr-binding forkhead associated (FHA) protein